MQITLTKAAVRESLSARRYPAWRVNPLRLVTLIIVAVVLLPIVYLVVRALGTGAEGVDFLLDGRTLAVVWNSLALMVAVMVASALIGVPFAWLTARTNLPFRRVWLIGGMLTMVIPSYIGAMMYIQAFGPRGLLFDLLHPLGVEAIPSIYGFFGAWLAITLFTYPYIVLPVRAALLNTDPALEDSARSLGLSRWTVFRRVTLPQLRPALGVGLLLTALYTLSDFGAVALMRYDAFTRVIYSQYTNSFDRSRAALLALVLVAVTLGLLFMERKLAAANKNYRAGTGCQRKHQPTPLGRWTIPALIFCALLVGVGVVTPVGLLIGWVGQSLSQGTLDHGVVRAADDQHGGRERDCGAGRRDRGAGSGLSGGALQLQAGCVARAARLCRQCAAGAGRGVGLRVLRRELPAGAVSNAARADPRLCDALPAARHWRDAQRPHADQSPRGRSRARPRLALGGSAHPRDRPAGQDGHPRRDGARLFERDERTPHDFAASAHRI